MLSRRHVHIDGLQGEPRHEDEEGDHREDATNGCVVRRIVLVGEADWLTKPIELLEELSVLVLRHDAA